ncbi:hypothetical protein O3M35_002505 [Rhynocoris fuscipes]|uniref:Uncharacterized protein n=1 Tax=Rhynocoris fuscipes TaxID=488301 RepID=A0AAW1CLM9_9HEMI
MNEYNLELKWKWFVDLQSFPQNGYVSKLFAETPKPKESKLRKSLPFWDITPLQCRLPSLGIKGLYYTRGKVGTTILKSSPDVDFITHDPYCYEHDSKKYDSLHDRHLGNYFKSKRNCAFLRKIGILDEEDYPKCSLADMNAYRQYLFRIHKDLVRREYNKQLNLRLERNLWKSAQQNITKHYFKTFKHEEYLKKSSAKRKEFIRQQRLKELKPIQILKKWDKRLKEIDERAKDEQLRRKEVKERETRRYKKVLERGKILSFDRPMKTLVKLRDQKLRFDEAERKRKEEVERNAGIKAESFIFNKSLEQHNKLELYKQLIILNDKGKEIARKKRDLEYENRRKQFEQQLQCRKMNKVQPVKAISAKEKAQKEILNKRQNKYERKVKQGMTHILEVLDILEDKEHGYEKKATKMIAPNALDNVLIQIAQQMIKRAILINITFTIRHFVTIILNYCLSPAKNLSTLLPSSVQSSKSGQYYPMEKCLRDAELIPDPDKITHGFIVNGVNILEEVVQQQNTTGLKAFLVRKQQLLSVMLTNARRLFNLIEDRVKLLKAIPDPYYNVPYLREEIMKTRKSFSIDEIIDKLVTLLTIDDKIIFESPLSGLGEMANLLAYARLATNYKVILNCDELRHEESKINISDQFDWDRLIEIHRLMKTEYDNIESEMQQNDTVSNWVEKSADNSHNKNHLSEITRLLLLGVAPHL